MSTRPLNPERLVREFIRFLETLSRESIHVKIIVTLARRGCLSLRGIAREVGMAPKNVRKYLEKLEQLGVITCIKPSRRMFLYRLSDEYSWLQELLRSTETPAETLVHTN
ncbi:MAG: winged helix-turn-helix domain-containing protein [Crenarchaeota archaeon]|nr:winged helix-turn-helix domain-containing protein [Thermoproteota archaeon]